MTSTANTRQAAEEMSDAVRAVAGFSATVTLLLSEDGVNLTPVGHSRMVTSGWSPGDSELTEPAIGDAPGARAIAVGVTLVYGTGDNPRRDLPLWATSRGFTTAIVIPLLKHGQAFGAVYAVRRDPQSPTSAEIHLAELAVIHGSRALPVLVRRSDGDEAEELTGVPPAANEPVRNLAPLRFDELQLDPVREQVLLGGVEVSLSRIEFMMLYTLGTQVNEIVPHQVLLEACWPEDIPILTAVDATVYRLRKKLARAETEAGKLMVKTVRGKGYLLAAGPTATE